MNSGGRQELKKLTKQLYLKQPEQLNILNAIKMHFFKSQSQSENAIKIQFTNKHGKQVSKQS